MNERFSVATPVFQGPLEALLDLIEERKMPVSQVSLSEVCDAYLAYVETLPELPLGETAQFILVASTLLLVKSRSLLPTLDLSPDERESVQELERRLARLRIIRKAARLLERRWGTAPLALAKRAPVRPVLFAPAEARTATLLQAGKRLLQSLPKPEALLQASVAPILALEDAIVAVRERLSRAIRARFSDLVEKASTQDRIVYFLAMLELVRSGSASVTQERLFADITIELESAGLPRYGA